MNQSELSTVRRRFVERLGLRIGSHTAEYVLKQLDAGVAFPVLAGDARTGRAVRAVVKPSELGTPVTGATESV